MAVDSAAAGGGGLNEPLPQKMDASPSELVSGEPSPSASPFNAPDRSVSSNSSPYSRKDAEIESPDILKSEEYRQLFRLPPEEVLIEDFNCALQENILIQGHMYLFVNFICFYSNIFGFETKRIIPLHEVTSVRRAKTAGLFPNAIEIFAGSRKYFFASFLSRDEAFNIINEGWSQQGHGSRACTEPQESMSESSSQENGIIAIDKPNSSDVLDNESLATNLNRDNSSKEPPSMTVPEQQSSVNQVVEPVSNDADTGMTWDWKEENSNAPEIPEVYTNVAESRFLIKVEDFFGYFFSDDAVNFLKSFHERCGDKDFKCTSWHPQEESGYTRENSFQHPIKFYLGAKLGGCHEVQTFRIYKNSHLVIETSQEVSDVPYADYFHVEGLWDVQRDENESKECCILRVYVNVAFSKKTIWKGKIVQSTIEECREAYATWIKLAHGLLKQKNLEKNEESGPTSSGTQAGEVNLDSEQETEESSERLEEASSPARVPPVSDIVNPSTNFGNRFQGNLVDSTSVSCLLRECMTKFRTSLKSQSHLSLFLVIIFAVIFFMQFSILVLLSRPQHVHVSTPADFMNRNGVSRSPSDIAWLEKRIHHLKDEMYMVESRLERMRYEHALLKNQLQDLELDHN